MIFLSIDYKMIGQRIKIIRKGNKMTQEQLAERLSVTVGYVSQIERGATKISLDTLAQIASILNCDIAFFITGTAINQAAYLQNELNQRYLLLDQPHKKIINEMIELFLKYVSDPK